MEFIKNVGGAVKSAFTSKGIETPSYEVKATHEDYEVREYPESRWVSTTIKSMQARDAQREGFWRLFNYIQGKNEKEMKIEMTAPVITKIDPGAGPNCESSFTISFFVPAENVDPPAPSNPEVFHSTLPAMTVYTRQFGGFAKEETWLSEAQNLAQAIEGKEKFHTDYHYTAGYDSPFKMFNRRNEVWFINAADSTQTPTDKTE